jgi:hypothetical protein
LHARRHRLHRRRKQAELRRHRDCTAA